MGAGLSRPIPVRRGIRQGCPISGQLYSLAIEPLLCRLRVSKAAADLMAYCDAHIRDDPLIMPVPASENPFREKKFFCSIL
uniref:Guanine nucleotide-binding protein subunit gamma n=1 Tax=Labrus bergylta TaxID=56723 RepID=A0A3Q3F8A7_9LABR